MVRKMLNQIKIPSWDFLQFTFTWMMICTFDTQVHLLPEKCLILTFDIINTFDIKYLTVLLYG